MNKSSIRISLYFSYTRILVIQQKLNGKQQAKISQTMETCNVCFNDVTDVVACTTCAGRSCRDCFRDSAMIQTTQVVPCMHCRTPHPLEFIVENIRRSPEWLEQRGNQLFASQQPLMPDTQETALTYMDAKRRYTIVRDLMDASSAAKNDLLRKYHSTRYGGNLQETHAMVGAFEFEIWNHDQTRKRLKRCIDDYGIGWLGYNFDTLTSATPTKKDQEDQLPFIKACPQDDCRGFLNPAFVCTMCACKCCKECHEVLQQEQSQSHTCDPSTKASIAAVATESRPCPSCAAAISKIDGCDQMWCTQCHATFSWLTGCIVEGRIHNPHYYEWMRRNGKTIPRHDEQPHNHCPADLNVYRHLYLLFNDDVRTEHAFLRDKINDGKTADLPKMEDFMQPLPALHYYYMSFIEITSMLTHHRSTANHHHGGHTLQRLYQIERVRYMANAIDATEFKRALVQWEYHHVRDKTLYSIHDMVFTASNDILSIFVRDCTQAQDKLTFCHDTYAQLQRLFTYANECLDNFSATFGATPKYEQNFYKIITWNKDFFNV